MDSRQGFFGNISVIMFILYFILCILQGVAVTKENPREEMVGESSPTEIEDGEKILKDDLVFEKIAELVKGSKKDEVTLPLKLGLEIALKNNLEIQIKKIDIPFSQEVIAEKEAYFDPTFFGEFYNQRSERQRSSALSGTPISKESDLAGTLGIKKPFKIGLEAELSFENSRYRNNSSFEGLDPQYKSSLLLNLRQPLLQNFGTTVNTVDIIVAKNNLEISSDKFALQVIDTLDKAEQTYYVLFWAIETLDHRKEALKLAEELLTGNRSRFKAGVTHIGEVQEAETAVASRQERVILARQRLKDITNLFKNILQIQPGSPLYPQKLRTEELSSPGEQLISFQQAFQRALINRPDLRRKKVEIENREIFLKYNKNQLLPKLDVLGTFGLNGLSGRAETLTFAGMSSTNPFGGDYFDSLEHLSKGDGYEWQLGLVAEIPLGNRADRSRYHQSKLDKRRAIIELKNLEEKIALAIKIALENIESSLGRFRVTETFEQLAAKTLHQEEERMKRGLSDTFRILNFQEDFTEAKIRKIKALIDYHKALATLYRAMGTNYRRHRIHLNVLVSTQAK